jgi:methanethiol S-methyltransferase
MSRLLAFLYGVIAYFIFFGTFLYLIGFVGGLVVPKTIDSGETAPFGTAIAINLALIALFGIQHTVMARPGFKAWWTKMVPRPVERSTYVLIASLILIVMMWQWRPMTGTVWLVENEIGAAIIWAFFAAGWLLVLGSTFAIDHFDLFGLRQVFRNLRGQDQAPVDYKESWFYRFVRHPLMLGFLIAFWAAPHMTVGHLLFAAGFTVYILIALQYEERDLVAAHGDRYKDYQRRVSMLIPYRKKRG